MAERNAALTRFGHDARANEEAVKALFAENTDLTERVVRGADGAEYVLLFLDGVVDKEALQRFVILPLSASCRLFGYEIHLCGPKVKNKLKVHSLALDFRALLW